MKSLVFLPHLKILTIVTIMINSMLWGCSSKKVSGCNTIQGVNLELTESVNPYLNSENPQEIKIVIDRFSEAEQSLSAKAVKDETLAPLTAKLASIYQQYSQVTSQYLVAYEQRNRDQIIQSKNQLNQLFEQQTQTLQQINDYCLN